MHGIVTAGDYFAGELIVYTTGMLVNQLQARGNKSTDCSTLTAEEVIFGTFLTRPGTVTEVDRDAGCIQVEDLTTMASLTVKQTPIFGSACCPMCIRCSAR